MIGAYYKMTTKEKQKWRDKSLKEKVERVAGVFGGKRFWDLWVFYTVILIWVVSLLPAIKEHKITSGLLAIFFFIVVVSKTIMIQLEAGLFDNSNKEGN